METVRLSTHGISVAAIFTSAVAIGMETADIDWIDDPDASANSREHFKQHLDEKWNRTRNAGASGRD